jgi:hypothetical protein
MSNAATTVAAIRTISAWNLVSDCGSGGPVIEVVDNDPVGLLSAGLGGAQGLQELEVEALRWRLNLPERTSWMN